VLITTATAITIAVSFCTQHLRKERREPNWSACTWQIRTQVRMLYKFRFELEFVFMSFISIYIHRVMGSDWIFAVRTRSAQFDRPDFPGALIDRERG
jgi:hypothetical protein